MKNEAISLDDSGSLLMVYGTCCLKLGDDVGFMNIYDALRPEIAKAGGMVSSAVAEDWRQFDVLRRKMVLKRRLMQGAVFVLLLVSLSLMEASTMVRLATYAIGCLVLFGRKLCRIPLGLKCFMNAINSMRYWRCAFILSLSVVAFSWLFAQIRDETHVCHGIRSYPENELRHQVDTVNEQWIVAEEDESAEKGKWR